jgi:hypothetical protein
MLEVYDEQKFDKILNESNISVAVIIKTTKNKDNESRKQNQNYSS